jgi:chromosome segregation protein
LREAEEALREINAVHRGAESDASRWRARAEMLALALEEAHAAAGGEEIASLDGVLGPLVDLLDIDDGCEVAVAAALGDALRAIVVDGDDAARAAVEQLKRGDRQALLLVAEGRATGMQISFAPAGTSPLGAFVRGLRPGLDAVLARLFAQFVLVDGGWEHALDVALANPGVVAVTRDGDRFGGSSAWRAGPAGSSVVTPAALADASARAEEAEATHAAAEADVEAARQRLSTARRAELRATEEERRARAELEQVTARAAQLQREVEVGVATIDARRATLAVRAEELEAEIATVGPDAVAAGRGQLDEAVRRIDAFVDSETSRKHGGARGAFELRPLVWIGQLSYSLYIWQQLFLFQFWQQLFLSRNWRFPLRGAGLLTFNLVCIFAFAACSFYFIEQPFIALGKRLLRQERVRASADAGSCEVSGTGAA